MICVYLASPYSGDIQKNVDYAKKCIRHSLSLNEAPFASHLFYTQKGILADELPEDRDLGMKAALCWLKSSSLLAVYTDLEVSVGMQREIDFAQQNNIPVHFRHIAVE